MRSLANQKRLYSIIVAILTISALVGAVVVIGLYKDSKFEDAWEKKSRLGAHEEQTNIIADVSIDDTPISETELNGIEIANIDSQEYIVLQTLQHPVQGITFKLLVTLSKNNLLTFKEIIGGDNKKYISRLGDYPWDWQMFYFTFWENDGHDLVHYSNTLDKNFIGQADVVKWLDDEIVIVNHNYRNGVNSNTIWLYNYKTTNLTVAFVSGQKDDEEIATDQISYQMWGNDKGLIVQRLVGDRYSNVYLETSKHLDDVFVLNKPVLITDKELNIDIISDYNLRNYQSGIKGEIDGKEVIIQWNQ